MTLIGRLLHRPQYEAEADDQDKADWEKRCIDKMLSIRPDLDVIEATQLAIAMWSIERFRERGPEAMAEVVFDHFTIQATRR